MSETADTATARTAAVAPQERGWSLEQRAFLIFAVATTAAWGHTLDEIRIGELIAVPFGLANLAVVAGWSRLRDGVRAPLSIAFGLFWGLAVLPYHIVPLFQGIVTGQHLSGILRLVAGAAMVALGVAMLHARRNADDDHTEE